MWIYPYRFGSLAAKALGEGLNIKRIKQRNSRFQGSPDKRVINWGATQLPHEVAMCDVVNQPHHVKMASNKLLFFDQVTAGRARPHAGDDIVPWHTLSPDEARLFIRAGNTIVCRTVLEGHSGQGIVMSYTEEQLVDAPLYVQYIKKKEEYRVHIMHRQVIDIQRKARKLEVPDGDVDWAVRNVANGFIYQRNDINVPECVTEVALKTFDRFDLFFGAVDVIYNAKADKAYVLEINTAPGLTGTTLDNYVHGFKTIL